MIHELRTYTLVPGKQAEYLRLSGEVGRTEDWIAQAISQ